MLWLSVVTVATCKRTAHHLLCSVLCSTHQRVLLFVIESGGLTWLCLPAQLSVASCTQGLCRAVVVVPLQVGFVRFAECASHCRSALDCDTESSRLHGLFYHCATIALSHDSTVSRVLLQALHVEPL